MTNDDVNYKIGHSHDPELRAKELSVGMAQPLSVVGKYEIETTLVHKLEALLHERLHRWHVRGENFCLPQRIVDKFSKIARVLEQTARHRLNGDSGRQRRFSDLVPSFADKQEMQKLESWLSTDQRREISILARSGGYSWNYIARNFQVSLSCIRRVVISEG